MKALLALVLLAAPAAAQTGPAATLPREPALRAEILARYAADQDVRTRLVAAGVAAPDSALLAEMVATDAGNVARIAEVVERHGWPSAALVGRDGVEAAFMIVQHADPATQGRMLPLVEAAYRAGELAGSSYALLLDRVRLGRGEPQVYGTQASLGPGGAVTIALTVDDVTLDARRAEVGLPPAADYLRMLRDLYAPGADPVIVAE